MTSLDIVYVNYNSTDCLIKSINILSNQAHILPSLNIIIVDNCSIDNPEQIKAHFPFVKLVPNKKNIGFGAAINQALTCCCSEYIVLLNPDTFVSEGFILTSVRFMDQNEAVGVMGPMIVDKDGSVQGSARSFPTPLTSLFGRDSPITKIYPDNSITRKNILTCQSDGQTPMEVDWVSGACMIVRTEAMKQVRGFDERFFLYWEDTDLCRRINKAGWKVIYYPAAKVTHYVGQSSNTCPIFANYQFHKSSFLLYKKYANWPYLALLPAAGMALIFRFALAVLFNYVHGALGRRY